LTEHVDKEDVELVDGLLQLCLCQLLISFIFVSPFHLPLFLPFFLVVTTSSFFSFSFSTPSFSLFFSTTLSLFYFSPLSFKPTTFPFLVVIALHCSFGLTCVFAKKDPLPCLDSCFSSCPT